MGERVLGKVSSASLAPAQRAGAALGAAASLSFGLRPQEPCPLGRSNVPQTHLPRTRSPYWSLQREDGCRLGGWMVIEDGRLSGNVNMRRDWEILSAQGEQPQPTIRFYRWAAPCLTVGMSAGAPEHQPAPAQGLHGGPGSTRAPAILRPTGGGIVEHRDDLSVSVVTPREHPWWPDSVRAVYRRIHGLAHQALQAIGLPVTLFRGPSCAGRSAWCFASPICDDLMLEGRKVMGGAIRKTKFGWLYQGTIQLPWARVGCSPEFVVEALVAAFSSTIHESRSLAPLHG